MARLRWLVVLAIGAAAGVAVMWWQPWVPRLEVGGVRINPFVELDPDKTYKIVVWDYELPIPWSNVTHRAALAEAVQELEATYANINVELVIRAWNEGDGPLRDRLEDGNPPDVLGMPAGVRLLAPEYQIPLERYLSPEDQADLFAAARRGASQGSLWAFPRWVSLSRWVIRTDRWPGGDLAAPTAAPPSLTMEQWQEALVDVRTKMGGSGLAANLLDPAFFRDLMVAATGKPFLAADGSPQWPEESICNVVNTLQLWMSKGLLPKDIENAARNRLARFWSGSAAAIAPVTPWLLHHILQRSGALTSPEGDPASPVATHSSVGKIESAQRSVVWTVPPLGRDGAAVAATISGYAVFRQAAYQGHDHTKAAVLVARFLSRRMSLWEASHLFAVPAYPSSIPDWLQTSRLPETDLQALLNWSAAAVAPPLDDKLARLEERIMAETAVPHLIQVLAGKMTPEQFAQELLQAPVSAAAALAAP